jgi:hypothetical protein
MAVNVSLPAELKKCCLLKVGASDRALGWAASALASWRRRNPQTSKKKKKKKESDASATARLPKQTPKPLQGSKAFPCNLIRAREPFGGVRYAEIRANGAAVGAGIGLLPQLPAELPGPGVSFVLATHAETINPTISDGDKSVVAVSVLEDALDEHLQVRLGELKTEAGRAAWAAFLPTVREGARVQFLFTRNEQRRGRRCCRLIHLSHLCSSRLLPPTEAKATAEAAMQTCVRQTTLLLRRPSPDAQGERGRQ